MTKIPLAIQFVVSLGVGTIVNFFILRAVLRKLNRPQDDRQRTRVAAIVALLLAVPSALNSRGIAAAEIEAAQKTTK
jgi:hypothetical protein